MPSVTSAATAVSSCAPTWARRLLGRGSEPIRAPPRLPVVRSFSECLVRSETEMARTLLPREHNAPAPRTLLGPQHHCRQVQKPCELPHSLNQALPQFVLWSATRAYRCTSSVGRLALHSKNTRTWFGRARIVRSLHAQIWAVGKLFTKMLVAPVKLTQLCRNVFLKDVTQGRGHCIVGSARSLEKDIPKIKVEPRRASRERKYWKWRTVFGRANSNNWKITKDVELADPVTILAARIAVF